MPISVMYITHQIILLRINTNNYAIIGLGVAMNSKILMLIGVYLLMFSFFLFYTFIRLRWPCTSLNNFWLYATAL